MADIPSPVAPPAPPKQTTSSTLSGAGVGGAFASIFGWLLYVKWGVNMPNEVTAAFASGFTFCFALIGNALDCYSHRKQYAAWLKTQQNKEPTP